MAAPPAKVLAPYSYEEAIVYCVLNLLISVFISKFPEAKANDFNGSIWHSRILSFVHCVSPYWII
jgi:hypothetical protein